MHEAPLAPLTNHAHQRDAAARLLLRQHRLLHLQVSLLQAKEDLALLQHPIEVGGVF
jgi:hypothetical protein